MPRIARIVVAGEPHHIIQRGNLRLPTFFKDDDWAVFLAEDIGDRDRDLLRGHGRTGRPLGGNPFFDNLQSILGKDVRPKKPGLRKSIREMSP
jgi:hypothetical protein